MRVCKNCEFQTLKFKHVFSDLTYDFHILKSVKVFHTCHFLSKITKTVHVSLNDVSDLPRTQFKKFDYILQTRLYSICYPVQRKTMWNCSKQCSNLGEKPITLIAFSSWKPSKVVNNFCEMDSAKNAIVFTETDEILLDNFVMNLVAEINVPGTSKILTDLVKFTEFNHSNVHLEYTSELSKFFPYLSTPIIKKSVFLGDDIDVDKILNMLPNIILHIFIPDFNYKEYDLLAKFLMKQTSNIWFQFHFEDSKDFYQEKDQLFQYFIQMKEQHPNQRGITFLCPQRRHPKETDIASYFPELRSDMFFALRCKPDGYSKALVYSKTEETSAQKRKQKMIEIMNKRLKK